MAGEINGRGQLYRQQLSPITMTNSSPHCRVIIIGAGFSRLGIAIQLLPLHAFSAFEIYDKANSIGRTW